MAKRTKVTGSPAMPQLPESPVRIRPYDLRHTYASLLIAAGKNPLYIARQMGHYSAGFTLETYGDLMEYVPKAQVEWIAEIVFAEGLPAALKLHLFDAPRGAAACSPLPSGEARQPLKNQENRGAVQSHASDRLVPPARFELAGGDPLTPPKPMSDNDPRDEP